MLELTRVFNYSISDKVNKDYKTIYILCNKKTVNVNNLKANFKQASIPISPDVENIFKKIISKGVNETMINIDNKYNVIISLFTENHFANNIANYLLSSILTNNIRNINLLLPSETDDTYYKFTEAFLVHIYNFNMKNVKTPNFFINYISKTLSKEHIQNLIFLTKSLFICKNNKIKQLAKLPLNPKIKLITNTNTEPYLYYNGRIQKQSKQMTKSNKLIVLIGSTSVIYSIITMCSLLNKNINIRGYTSVSANSKIPSNAKLIQIRKTAKNSIKYSSDTSKTMITKLVDESAKLSIPITFKEINRTLATNIVKMNINNECMAVRLLAIL
jgi:hypothetical protein